MGHADGRAGETGSSRGYGSFRPAGDRRAGPSRRRASRLYHRLRRFLRRRASASASPALDRPRSSASRSSSRVTANRRSAGFVGPSSQATATPFGASCAPSGPPPRSSATRPFPSVPPSGFGAAFPRRSVFRRNRCKLHGRLAVRQIADPLLPHRQSTSPADALRSRCRRHAVVTSRSVRDIGPGLVLSLQPQQTHPRLQQAARRRGGSSSRTSVPALVHLLPLGRPPVNSRS